MEELVSQDKLKSVKRHRINFFLEENIKEIFGKSTYRPTRKMKQLVSQDRLKSVKRHRINFFLEENIKEIFGKCTKELKLLVLQDMINDTKKT